MFVIVQFETYQKKSQLHDPYLYGIVDPLAISLRHTDSCQWHNVERKLHLFWFTSGKG